MRQVFDKFFPKLLAHEGGYVNHPRDPGGITNLGVTKKVWEAYCGKDCTAADMRALTPEKVKPLYKKHYWDQIGGDTLPAGVDACLFDIAVNSGVGRARKWWPLYRNMRPVDAIKAICAKRRSFFMSLSTFDTFGRGWMRRVNEVEAQSLKIHFEINKIPATPTLSDEAAESRKKEQKAKGAAVATGGAGGATPAVAQGALDWVDYLIIGGCVMVAVGVLAYIWHAHASRREAMDAAIKGAI